MSYEKHGLRDWRRNGDRMSDLMIIRTYLLPRLLFSMIVDPAGSEIPETGIAVAVLFLLTTRRLDDWQSRVLHPLRARSPNPETGNPETAGLPPL